MDSLKLKKILTFMLLICLFIGLVIFCVLYIWTNRCQSDGAKMETNATTDHLHQTTEHPHHHHHDDDTTVSTTTTLTTTDDGEDSVYKLSLEGGPEGNSGKVLIKYFGEQGFVCSDGFDDNDAQVVCKELGYRKGLSYNLIPVRPTSYNRYTNLQPILTGLNCNGTESAIHECDGTQHLYNETMVCTWFAAVLCYDDKPYELRLVGGVHPHSGMVEMKVGGVWGIFCAVKTHDDEVADILCRSMNYTGGFTSSRGMLGESPSSKVWVPYISCQEHVENLELLHSVFECDLVLNVENIAYDYLDDRGNANRNEYTACINKPNSYAATVQCLK